MMWVRCYAPVSIPRTAIFAMWATDLCAASTTARHAVWHQALRHTKPQVAHRVTRPANPPWMMRLTPRADTRKMPFLGPVVATGALGARPGGGQYGRCRFVAPQRAERVSAGRGHVRGRGAPAPHAR